jgi:hypothetical protein
MAEVVGQAEHTPKMASRKGEKRPHREPLRREADRKRLADLLLMGEKTTTRQLAAALNLSPTTVRRDLAHLKAEWQRERSQDFDTWLSRQVAELGLVIREGWHGWRQSQQPSRSAKSKSKGLVKKPPDGQKRVSPRAEDVLEFESVTGEKTSAGDVRFLELIERSLAARARLLGLDKPIKIAPTDPTGEEAYGDARARLLAALEQKAAHLAVPLPTGILGAGEQPALAPAPVEVVEQADGTFASVDSTGETGEIEVPSGFRLR